MYITLFIIIYIIVLEIHNNTVYKQKFDLLIGSPLCAVLACMYLEFLISGPFRFGLVCWVLWHINICRLFNAKSIFM